MSKQSRERRRQTRGTNDQKKKTTGRAAIDGGPVGERAAKRLEVVEAGGGPKVNAVHREEEVQVLPN